VPYQAIRTSDQPQSSARRTDSFFCLPVFVCFVLAGSLGGKYLDSEAWEVCTGFGTLGCSGTTHCGAIADIASASLCAFFSEARLSLKSANPEAS
jgi:hypothetical protein